MARWRIRINLSDDAQSRARLHAVLVNQRVSVIQLIPRAGREAMLDGHVELELAHDDQLGDMLSALHMISPQVFVSLADRDHGASPGRAVTALAPADVPARAD